MIYVHGHAACANNACPLYGQNQAECCSGETAESCPALVVERGPSCEQPLVPSRRT
jgi:hypothetical protein